MSRITPRIENDLGSASIVTSGKGTAALVGRVLDTRSIRCAPSHQIAEMFSIHTELSKAEINTRVLALLADVRIPDPRLAARPIRTNCPAGSANAR